MTSPSLPLLNVQHLSKSFGGVKAVRDMHLTVNTSELVALIGPNGAGKSTTFNMINGQIQPDAGEVVFEGQSLVKHAPRSIWRRGVGRTFQTAAVFGSMTVLENVQMVMLSHDRQFTSLFKRACHHKTDQARAVLDQVGLGDQADRGCDALAYADLKRVELAMAIANRPRLLLMDEPAAGMAPAERHQLMGLIRDLARQTHMGVLFTEHSMDVVFGYADRVLVMARGALIAQGTPNEVQADPEVAKAYFGRS